MGKKYAKVIEERIEAWRQVEKETYVQFMYDMFSVTLNDPDVMGRDVFGERRMLKVLSAVSRNYDLYHEAIEKSDEADVVQDKLDKKLKKIFGARFDEFKVRYPWIKEQKYRK